MTFATGRWVSSPPITDRILTMYARTGWRGLSRLWDLLGYRSGDTVQFATPYGTVFCLDPWAYIDSIVLRNGYYESEVLNAIVAGLQGQGVLWDVGANFGLHGLTAKKLVPSAQVVCFEPSPAIIGRLWCNRVRNGLDVQVVTSALSDGLDYRTFYIASSGNPGMSTLSPWAEAKYESQTLVQTACGDVMVKAGALPSPTVIKLDVEGHEEAVLRGVPEILSSSCRVVVFEDGPDADSPVKALLSAAGYCFEPLARHESSRHSLMNFVARRFR